MMNHLKMVHFERAVSRYDTKQKIFELSQRLKKNCKTSKPDTKYK